MSNKYFVYEQHTQIKDAFFLSPCISFSQGDLYVIFGIGINYDFIEKLNISTKFPKLVRDTNSEVETMT